MNEVEYKYDAFISYRHLLLDKAVAIRLQKLLESFKPPKGLSSPDGKRITGRVFRDQSELPLSGDLGGNIRFALQNSRFLILICSSETINSRWCMEELRYFKELHGGQTNNILTVLVEGEPGDVFPKELRYETSESDCAGDMADFKIREIEPLCADVRAQSTGKSLKKLKTEFLRIAAAIIGCGYDELYRRHQRRKKKNAAFLSTAAAALAVCVSLAIGSFKRQADDANAARFHRQAADIIMNGGDAHLGMMFFARSLELNPKVSSPQTASLALLLQDNSWGFVKSEFGGRIVDGAIITSAGAQAPAFDGVFLTGAGVDIDSVVSVGRQSARMLVYTAGGGYVVKDTSGEIADNLHIDALFLKLSADGGAWIFRDREGYYIYDIADGHLRRIEPKTLIHPRSIEISTDVMPNIEVYDDAKKAVISYGGYLSFYSLENESYIEYKSLDLESYFDNPHNQASWIYPVSELFVDESGKLLAVSNMRDVCLINLDTKEKLYEVNQYQYLLSGVSFSPGSRYMAIYYGAAKINSGDRAGGFFHVYDVFGGEVLSSEGVYDEAVAGVCFAKDSALALSYSFDGTIRLWRISDGGGQEMSQPISLASGLGGVALGGEDYVFAAQDAHGSILCYSLLAARGSLVVGMEDNRYPILFTKRTAGGELGLLTNNMLFYFDEERAEITEKHRRGSARYMEFISEYGIYMQKQSLLDAPYKAFELGDGSYITYDSGSLWMIDKNEMPLDRQNIAAGRSGAEIAGAAVSRDKKLVFIACSGTPFIAAYEIDTAGHKFNYLWRVETPGYSPDAMWVCGDRKIAVSTRDNTLLIYGVDDMKKPPVEIRCATVGAIKELIVSDDNAFLAVSVQKRVASSAMLDIDPYGVLEVWDLASRSLVTSITDKSSYLNGLCFDGKYLYYALDEELHRKWLPSGGMSRERLNFFRELSGYALDGEEPRRAKAAVMDSTPARLAGDECSRLYETISTPNAHGQRMLWDVLQGLRTIRMLYGDDKALGGYIEAEADITNGVVVADLLDVKAFYAEYLYMLRQIGENEDVRGIVSRFVSNIERPYLGHDINELGGYKSAQLTLMPMVYIDSLTLSASCDDIIAGALDRMAEYYDTYDMSAAAFSDLSQATATAYRFCAAKARYVALLLNGKPEEAAKYMADYLLLEDEAYYTASMLPELTLMAGDAALAARQMNAWYEMQDKSSNNIAYVKYTISLELNWLYALKQRGILSLKTITQYLNALDFKPYIEISAVSDKARAEGILEGDVVLFAGGERIFCEAQIPSIVYGSAGDSIKLELLRNSAAVSVQAVRKDNKIGVSSQLVISP